MSSINTSATGFSVKAYCQVYFNSALEMSCPLPAHLIAGIATDATHFEFKRCDDDNFVGFIGRVEYQNGCAVEFRKGLFVEGTQKWALPKQTIWAEDGCWEISFWQKSPDGSWKAGIEGVAKEGWTGPFADQAVYGECANIRSWTPPRKPIKVTVRVRKGI